MISRSWGSRQLCAGSVISRALPYPPHLDLTPGLGGVEALQLGGGAVRVGGGNEDDDDHGCLLTLRVEIERDGSRVTGT